MWMGAWLATVAACLVAVLALSRLSSESFEGALEGALADHLSAQAGLAAVALQTLPVESIAALGGERSAQRVTQSLGAILGGSQLTDLALIGPDGVRFGAEGRRVWIAEQADAALIAEAASGETRAGPLYRGEDGALYLAAYTPFPGHPGWVVAVEGSGATLRAVDELEQRQLWTSAGVLLVAVLIGAALAGMVARPLRRLSHELGTVKMRDGPAGIAVQGPREVRQVAVAARAFLSAISQRDAEIQAGHQRELRQVTALAAAVAHEVRNPLNALSLTLTHLGSSPDPAERSGALAEASELVEEVDQIVDRFMDVARMPVPELAPMPLQPLLSDLQQESALEGLVVVITGDEVELVTDRRLLRQAIRNLLANARQAGANRVSVRVVARPAQVSIEVMDDGPGVAAHVVPHLFDWFETTRATGTGLGLPMARRALRTLDGDIELAWRQPATFRITLNKRSS